MSVVDEARRLITTDTSMAVSNPEWRRIVAALIEIIEHRDSRTEPDVDAEIDTLMKFYAVTTLDDLVRIQCQHVAKLQAKLPPTRDTAIGRVREG